MFALRVMLEYFHPWPNSAGFYLARERGWYRDAGLDVELVVHDPYHGDTLDHLERGAAAFGVFPSNRLLVRRELGQPLIGVAAINHRGLESIQTLTDSGISAMAATVGLLITIQIVNNIPQLHALQPYLFPHYWLSFADVMRAPVIWDGIVKNLALQALYAAVFGSAAWARFTTRDITS